MVFPSVLTITDLHLADDLRNATVYISLLGEDAQKKDAVTALNKASPYIQRQVAGRIRIKHFPRLYFKFDRALDRSQRIDELLEEVKDDLV